MKKIAFIRHGRKDGENIAADQLTEIEKNGIAGLNELLQPGQEIVICLGSELDRTAQTILAFESYMKKMGSIPAQILAADVRFGNANLFSQMVTNAELMAEVKTNGWYHALLKITPDLLREIQQAQYAALSAIFDAVPEGDQVIIVGHTPMIEILAIYADDQNPYNGNKIIPTNIALKELQGIMFVQDLDPIANDSIKTWTAGFIGC